MLNNMEYPELLAELQKLQMKDSSATGSLPPEQNKRICHMALSKIGYEKFEADPSLKKNMGNDTMTQEEENMNKKGSRMRTLRRALRIGMIAAALCCAGAVTAYAVGPQLISMLGESIGFFSNAPSQKEVNDPMDAPRGSYTATRQKLEAFNAPVGQSVTDNGITVTLDTISMDVASMDIFLTIKGDEAIENIEKIEGYGPLWGKFYGAGPNFYWLKINGREIAQPDVEDWYLADDGSLKLWRHYLLTEAPQGDEITVELNETERALDRSGKWCFTVTLDGDSVRAGGKTVEPGTYPVTEVTYSNFDGFGNSLTLNQDIGLSYLAFGPKGGVIETEVTEKTFTNENGNTEYAYEGLDANMLYITDDTGKELYSSKSTSIGGSALNLTSPDPAATKLTLTPMWYQFQEDGPASETRTITTAELKNGVKVETSAYGGYTVKNFSILNGVISYDLVPYGWNLSSGEVLRPQDDDKISMVSEEATELGTGQPATLLHSALLSSTFDPQTGVVSVRHDYYAATDQELQTITQWKYEYFYVEKDTEHAITVDLRDMS